MSFLKNTKPIVSVGEVFSTYIVAVQRKTSISKMVTLQEMPKTSFNFKVSQWNQTSFRALLGHFSWSIHHANLTKCKRQQLFSNDV